MKPINFKFRENRGFWITFAVYFILFLADICTTLAVSHYAHLETNPLFIITHSMIPIVLINIGVCFAFLWFYLHEKARPLMRFMALNYMVIIILTRIYALHNALSYIKTPISLEQAQTVTTAMKMQTVIPVATIMIALLFQAIITFIMWQCDHKVENK